MAKAIKGFIIAFFTAFFTKWVEDFFIFIGIALLVANTYLLSSLEWATLAGNYLLALFLILIGVIMAKR